MRNTDGGAPKVFVIFPVKSTPPPEVIQEKDVLDVPKSLDCQVGTESPEVVSSNE